MDGYCLRLKEEVLQDFLANFRQGKGSDILKERCPKCGNDKIAGSPKGPSCCTLAKR